MTTVRQFHYSDGQIVHVGDRVRVDGRWIGVVVEIVQPGTELAKMFHSPDGGVLIDVGWGNNSGIFMAPPDGRNWEDLELIERAKK